MDTGKTILIVEDDQWIQTALREVLEGEGYIVRTANNGKQALEILESGDHPALIFLDIAMPVMNGHQFLKLFKADNSLSAIPVVVTSANAQLHEVIGATSFIKKPLDLDLIISTAQRYCGAGVSKFGSSSARI